VDTFGVDQFRYFLLREVPFGQDGDFSGDALLTRVNSDLANDLGNLLNRTLTMLERYAGSRLPEPGPPANLEQDTALQQTCVALPSLVHLHLENLEFNRALEAIWGLVQLGNQYIDKCAPWNLAKNPRDAPRLNTVLYNSTEILRFVCLMVYPFMPQAAEEMTRQLGLMLNFSKPLLSSEITWGGSIAGTKVSKGRPLFPRIEPPIMQGEIRVSEQQPSPKTPEASALPNASAQSSPPPATEEQISIDDFKKVTLRVGKVLAAERVPKSTKLLKLQVDLGSEQRQIVAGIGTQHAPEAMLGKRIVVVANIKPVKLMGVESQGMVLAAGDQEVTALLTTLEDVPPGSRIK
jgi:methionyl-tRNA synthetase